MDTHTPKFEWQELPQEDRSFYVEMGVGTALAAALFLLI